MPRGYFDRIGLWFALEHMCLKNLKNDLKDFYDNLDEFVKHLKNWENDDYGDWYQTHKEGSMHGAIVAMEKVGVQGLIRGFNVQVVEILWSVVQNKKNLLN